ARRRLYLDLVSHPARDHPADRRRECGAGHPVPPPHRPRCARRRLPEPPPRTLPPILEKPGPILFLLPTECHPAGMAAATWPSRSYLLLVVAKLVTAWVVIALAAGLIRNAFVYRLVSVSAWIVTALSILSLLNPVTTALDSIGLNLGGIRLTPLLVLKT